MTTLLNNSDPRIDSYGTPKTIYCEKNSPFIFAFYLTQNHDLVLTLVE